ncbi:hypothetical protein B9Z65_4236 [Elsinoe australis]|uniref:non-specific serine/threonine protein kinase n=1 Tax=Elsinoe australis TaxID=40998 RepID=A0A2P7Z276_9PEZI|nr:hypothetical protein B9Z65_4236 [Elsinoe australis]
MAPRQVYGKRSKVYTALSLLESPPKCREDVNDLANAVSGLAILDTGSPQLTKGIQVEPRAALVSICKNRQPKKTRAVDSQPDKPPRKTTTRTRKAKPKEPSDPKSEPAAEEPERVSPAPFVGIVPSTKSSSPEVISIPTKSSASDLKSDGTLPSLSPPCPRTTTNPTTIPNSHTQTTHQDPSPPLLACLSPELHSHLSPLLPYTTSPITTFTTFTTNFTPHFTIKKLAEASFSQVFLLHPPIQPHSPHRTVLKLIPLLPAPSATPAPRPSKSALTLLSLSSTPKAVASEARLLAHLTSVPGFTIFRGLNLLQGRPGGAFAKAAREWNKAQKERGKEGTLVPDMGRRANYEDGQLWAVVEMEDAGVDLERMLEGSGEAVDDEGMMGGYGVAGIWDVWWQVVLAAGKGEVACGWESRDLHCGNVCVRERKGRDGEGRTRREEVGMRLEREMKRGRGRKLGLTGLEVTIIDYTISRAEVVDEKGEKEIAFIDLNEDECLFQGDGAEEYQYDIYRFMRAAVFLDDPLADVDTRWDEVEGSDRSWKDFHPETNVVWLHFILHKLLEHYHWSTEADMAKTDRKLDLLQRREREMENVLGRLQEILKLENWESSGIRSAEGLVALAMKEQWLNVDDVMGLLCDQFEPDKRSKKSKTKTKTTSRE